MDIINFFDKYSPGPLEVVLFATGLSLLLASLGVVTTLSLGKSTITIPTTRKWKIIFGLGGVGMVLVSIALSLQKPVWKPGVSEELVYLGKGKTQAQQIVADGEQLYVLTRVGNIVRVADKNDKKQETVDSAPDTKQIVAAGGVLYVLKNDGNIWAVVLAEKREYKEIDPGTNTRRILAAGEALYVLKENGEVWRVWTSFSKGKDKAGDKSGKIDLRREFTPLHGLEEVGQIASSGSVLFILRPDGVIQRYFPMPESEAGFMDMKECGQAKYIAADAATLYLIDPQDQAFMCRVGSFERVFNKEKVVAIDANGGVAYILTSEGKIWRWDAVNKRLRPTPLFDPHAGDSPVISIAAHHQGCFAVKADGTVWRYSEFVRKL